HHPIGPDELIDVLGLEPHPADDDAAIDHLASAAVGSDGAGAPGAAVGAASGAGAGAGADAVTGSWLADLEAEVGCVDFEVHLLDDEPTAPIARPDRLDDVLGHFDEGTR
ncbi:MAG: hypothetical protein AAGG08_18900, partial [Actinomycetota bacterium]